MSATKDAYVPKNLFIRRPILASVLSIIIVLLGLFALQILQCDDKLIGFLADGKDRRVCQTPPRLGNFMKLEP